MNVLQKLKNRYYRFYKGGRVVRLSNTINLKVILYKRINDKVEISRELKSHGLIHLNSYVGGGCCPLCGRMAFHLKECPANNPKLSNKLSEILKKPRELWINMEDLR